jgi:cytidine deaminase
MTNEQLIEKAVSVINLKTDKNSQTGSVGCALVTNKNNIYVGVCIDTRSSMGFCAEHNTIGTMITEKEYTIKKIVAIWKDDKDDIFVIPPCGRCREFMRQLNEVNLEADVVLYKDKVVKLKELLPYYDWWQKIT